jgi:hypothetical protein
LRHICQGIVQLECQRIIGAAGGVGLGGQHVPQQDQHDDFFKHFYSFFLPSGLNKCFTAVKAYRKTNINQANFYWS